MKKLLLCFLALAVLAGSGEAYRILCLFPFNGKSHHLMFDALCKGLARRGHQIDMISHFPSKAPPENFKDIVDLNGTLPSVVNSFTVGFARNLNHDLVYQITKHFGEGLCQLMANEQMQRFIKNAPKGLPYDLIVMEYFGSPCYLGFGEYLKAPIALAISSVEMPYVDEFIANPLSNSFFPGLFTNEAVLTTFKERLTNTITNLVQTTLFFHYTSTQTATMREFLGADLPDVRELEKRISLVLTNSHYSFHGVRPTTPALITVGGLHIAEDKSQLTKELKIWLDSADAGVVYFTLGSLINIETLPEEQLLDLYASFGKIAPVKVLMKCADSTKLPAGLPKNVLTLPWIPQVAVLKHKNVKLFITHGGLMGSMEALNFGIPMIGIPVFADQWRNVNIFVHKGMALLMTLDEINRNSMDRALDALLNNPKYMEAAKRESRIFKDRPQSPMETAIYWIEYVIRHGADSLRSPGVDLSWWQRSLLDVYAFLIGCLVLLIYILKMSIKFLIRCVRRTKPQSITSKKKRN